MNDQLERDLRTVLGDIIAQAPQALRQPDRLTVVEVCHSATLRFSY